MPCIVLRGPAGTRLVEQGKPYKRLPGEQITGIDWKCGAAIPDGRKYRKCSSCGELGVYEYT